MTLPRLIFIFLVYGFPTNIGSYEYECSNLSELQCIFRYHSDIYHKDPIYFWKVINHAQYTAYSCKSVKATADFLHITKLHGVGADLEEYISESIETLCVKKPVCLKRAMNMLDKKTQHSVKVKLKNPIYFGKNEIAACYH